MRRLTKLQIQIVYDNYFREAENSITRDPKAFLAFIQSKTQIFGLMTNYDKTFDTPEAIQTIFQQRFHAT